MKKFLHKTGTLLPAIIPIFFAVSCRDNVGIIHTFERGSINKITSAHKAYVYTFEAFGYFQTIITPEEIGNNEQLVIKSQDETGNISTIAYDFHVYGDRISVSYHDEGQINEDGTPIFRKDVLVTKDSVLDHGYVAFDISGSTYFAKIDEWIGENDNAKKPLLDFLNFNIPQIGDFELTSANILTINKIIEPLNKEYVNAIVIDNTIMGLITQNIE